MFFTYHDLCYFRAHLIYIVVINDVTIVKICTRRSGACKTLNNAGLKSRKGVGRSNACCAEAHIFAGENIAVHSGSADNGILTIQSVRIRYFLCSTYTGNAFNENPQNSIPFLPESLSSYCQERSLLQIFSQADHSCSKGKGNSRQQFLRHKSREQMSAPYQCCPS